MTMCDEVLADLQRPRKRVAGFKPAQIERLSSGKTVSYDGFDAVKRCYQEMRLSSRYVVSNDLLEYLVPIFMMIPPDQLVERIIEARLPHQNVWVEWDEIQRQTLMRKWAEDNGYEAHFAPLNEILPTIGYLLMADARPDAQHWLAMPFVNGKNTGPATRTLPGITCSTALSFVVYPELDSPLPEVIEFGVTGGEISVDLKDKSEEAALAVATAAIGNGYMSQKFRVRFPGGGHDWENHAADLRNLYTGIGTAQTFASEWEDQKNSSRWPNMAINMVGGDARFLVCLLSVLNYDWIIKDEVPATAAPRRIRHGKVLPRNSHTTLTIDLPKARGVTMLPTPYVDGASRRQHEVRGHWRRYRKTGKRVWVRSHKRGDAKLGVITKDYLLHAA